MVFQKGKKLFNQEYDKYGEPKQSTKSKFSCNILFIYLLVHSSIYVFICNVYTEVNIYKWYITC